MTEFFYFLGRFHVLVLHFPIGLLLLAVTLEILTRRQRFAPLAPAVNFVWLAGALSAMLTVSLGYMHATEPGFDSPAVNAHRYAGSLLMALAFLVWGMRALESPLYASAWPAFSAAIVAMVMITGHLGGNLTHGDTYLVAYAPAPVRSMLGMQPARSRPADLASADVFADVVGPILERRCVACHNEGRRRGGLVLASYADAMAGGEDGPVIAPGDLAGSDLSRRINLPQGDEDFMPAEGKTPLTPQETAVVDWWIAAGAPESGIVAGFGPEPEVATALASVLGLDGAAGPASGTELAAGEDLPQVPAPDAADLQAVAQSGFSVRPISQESNLVDVDFMAQRDLEDADVERLARLGEQVRKLNLRDAGVTDAQLEVIAGFPHLAHLRLELNPVTDAGVAHLAALDQLEYLNLFGTQVSDEVFASLAGLERLDHLYVWMTAVTEAGIGQFKDARPGVAVDDGFDRSRLPESPDIIPIVN